MQIKLIIISIFCITSTIGVQISQTKISISRNELRKTLCNYYNGNFSDSERTHAKVTINQYSYLSDSQIQNMLFKQDFSAPSIQSFLIVAPHAACLCILIIMIPGLACCCARPDKYPVCKKWRKAEDQMYTKVQLKWPAYCTVFFYVLIAVGSAMAVASGPEVTNHVNNIGCRITALADDTLNGRVSPSEDAVFFSGLSPLKSQLTDFASKYNTFFSQSNTSLNTSQQVRTHQTAIQSQIASQYTTYTNIAYSSAFRQSNGITYAIINSQFKDLYYGPVSDSTKILGNIYAQIQVLFAQINAALDPIIAAWVYLQSQTQAGVVSLISSTISKITDHETQLSKTLLYYQIFDHQTYYDQINLAMKIVYGLILSLALLGLVCSIVLTCCTVVRIRMVLYFTCSFLIFMAVITFSMLIVFGIFLPNVSQACAYIDRKLSTEDGIVELFTNLQFNSSAVLFTKCSYTNGTGDMIDKLNTQFTRSFQSIDLISDYTLKFNDLIPNFQTSKFQKPFDQTTVLLNQIKIAQKLQINDTVAMSFLTGLANIAYTLDPVQCTSPANVRADSWVPSRQVISCQGGTYAQTPCNDLSNTVTCPQGCYQMYQQLNTPLGDSSAYATNLNLRYGSNCNYANYVIDLQQNWTNPKKANIATVTTNVNLIKSNVDSYQSRVSSIQGNLNSFKSNLIQNFNSQTNAVYGTFNGLNCKVIGESIIQLRDSVCVGLLNNIQYNTIMLCIISYGILLISCFTVCAGVRHYQHLQKMQVKVGYKGVPVSISSNRIIDKFDA